MLINFCVHVMCVFSFYKTFQALPLLPPNQFRPPYTYYLLFGLPTPLFCDTL